MEDKVDVKIRNWTSLDTKRPKPEVYNKIKNIYMYKSSGLHILIVSSLICFNVGSRDLQPKSERLQDLQQNKGKIERERNLVNHSIFSSS